MSPVTFTTIVRTEATGTGITLTLADAKGQEMVMAIPFPLVAALSGVLSDCVQSDGQISDLTKMPKHVAVGRATHEEVVLLRFEDDIPYGLSPAEAKKVGLELVAQSDTVRSRAPRRIM